MTSSTFDIDGHAIGGGARPFVVAEVALAHDGSLGTAHAFIDAAADAGADAVKFQTHIAEAESTRDEPFRVAFSRQDATRYAYWQRTSFTEEQWRGLAEHARERSLVFLSTPFSLEAVELLARVGVPAWKVGSGEVTNAALLDRLAESGLPVILSSGMSTYAELDQAADRLRGRAPFAVLQCTSEYPVAPERLGLALLPRLAERYGVPVGLSDHSGTIFPSIAAVALGASLLEIHLTLGRGMFGPDVPASVTPEELAQLVRGVEVVHRGLAAADKDSTAGELAEMRSLFTRSVAPRTDLPAGTVLEAGHLTLKKPGTGIAPERLPELVGRRLRRDVRADELLREEDLA